jgi:hypothetical protein
MQPGFPQATAERAYMIHGVTAAMRRMLQASEAGSPEDGELAAMERAMALALDASDALDEKIEIDRLDGVFCYEVHDDGEPISTVYDALAHLAIRGEVGRHAIAPVIAGFLAARPDLPTLIEAVSADGTTLRVPSNTNAPGAVWVFLASCGNPDLRQHSDRPLPGVQDDLRLCSSIEVAKAAVLQFVADNDLGGGNWFGGTVFAADGSGGLGRISYNGRYWPDVDSVLHDLIEACDVLQALERRPPSSGGPKP